ncbi:MAG: helix-hairpin-helix domain-containing protein [Chitinispirillia bacterium]|nr:helix-hairpin-helix domain-containing protein [Chitinispirillia bacterium]MCL2242408.1 helix-hairpin-helix domain-containing protein [Chitinispirillia bacterium]
MDTIDKLKLLSDASQYDLACACGTRGGPDHRVRGDDGSWLYPVSMPGGGYSIMLKTLVSNVCSNDCGYCPFRESQDVRRCTIGADEMAKLFMDYVRRRKLIGIFLSSGVVGTPDNTMDLINGTAEILRRKYAYRGYIHLKVIPGASDAAIDHAVSLANAVSVNIEVPGEKHFTALSQKKDFLKDIIAPMRRISQLTDRGMRYQRVRQTTQFIVGAADESDAEIVKYTSGLYRKLKLGRVYFSAYQRGLGNPAIPGERHVEVPAAGGFVREHRLYQVDFLFRQYGFCEDDIAFDGQGRLFTDRDPKLVWAESHPERFPVDVNRADLTTLLKVPGIGPLTAKRIVRMRKGGARISSADGLPLKGKRLAQARQYLKY